MSILFFAFEDPLKIGLLKRVCLVGYFPLCNFYVGFFLLFSRVRVSNSHGLAIFLLSFLWTFDLGHG